MRGLFVTGTDTAAGKTVLTATIVAALRAQGLGVRAVKPVITGLDEPSDGAWPRDDELLAEVSGATPEEVSPFRYGPAVSPHLAAEMNGGPLDPAELVRAVCGPGGGAGGSGGDCGEVDGAGGAGGAGGAATIVEGAGGLLVPIADGYDMRALARDLDLPVVIAARPGLGTINHTLLTVEAARHAGLKVAGIALTPWPETPSELEESNRATISRLAGLDVSVLPFISRPAPALLAAAGASLPLAQWLS